MNAPRRWPTLAESNAFRGVLQVLAILALGACLTSSEKTVIRTIADIAKELCTPAMTLDACLDRILADARYQDAKRARLASPDGGH